MKSITGKKIWWIYWSNPKKIYKQSLEDFAKEINGKIIREHVYVEAMIAGDNRKKGISIVNLLGDELMCIKPDIPNKTWNMCIKLLKRGYISIREADELIGGIIGNNPQCPYK